MRPAEEIERLLKGLADRTSAAFDEHTVRDMFGALDETERTRPARSWRDIGRAIMESRIGRVTVAAALVLTVLLLARHLAGREVPVESQEPTVANDNQNDDSTPSTPIPSQQEQQLRLAHELFAQSDVEGLLGLLETGLDQTRIVVAGYLGQLGDTAALPALQQLADRWQGAPDDNPFRRNTEQIRQAAARQDQAEGEAVTQEAEPETAPVTEAGHIRITVEVRDEVTGQPIPQATIRTSIGSESRMHEADEQGMFVFDLGESVPAYASVTVRQAGYVWQSLSLQGRNRESVPRMIRFSLERDTVVGGIVQDSEGRPVEGASVEGHYSGHRVQEFDQPEMTISIRQTTDAEGRWQSGGVPAEVDEFWFNVYHPNFADGGFSVPGDLSLADLQAESAVMVLDAGIRVVGTVTDTAGNPIAGADLLAAEDYFARDWTKTDANGLFEFRNLDPINSSFPLTVQAPGFTPQRRELPSRPGLAPVEFVLSPAQPLIGRVVDAAGDPVEDAFIVAEDWNGYRTLKWQTRTDSEGVFVWDYPPDDAVEIRINKSGYREFLREVVSAGSEQTFVLLKPMVIKGTVTDGETGEPISRFRVVPGIDWSVAETNRATWQDVDGQTKWFTNGQYRYAFSGDGKAYAVRIEAEGYALVESRFVDATGEEVTIDLALTKGQGPSGYVFDANAEPAVGVEVFWDDSVQVRNGEVAYKTQRSHVMTDADGHFVFPPQPAQYSLVAVCEEGIGVVSYEDFMRDRVIVLTPWARVVGELRFGTQPAADEQLLLMGEDRLARDVIRPENQTITDQGGRFVFERVHPGRFRLYNQTYEVASGQTLELHLGGTGRSVHGRLALPGLEDVPVLDMVDFLPLRQLLGFDRLPKPPGYETMSLEEVRAWANETRADRLQSGQIFAPDTLHASVDEEHAFRLDNVEPGTYAVRARVLRTFARRSPSTETVGRLWCEFEVPPLTDAGELDVPLDLGTLVVLPVALGSGDIAADFDVPTFEGGRIRLADYRGRVLLVSFHTAYESANSGHMATLRDLQQRFGADSQYAQVSLLVTSDLLVDKKAYDEAKLQWPAGYVRGFECEETFAYAVATLPWNVLIDADGTILAAGVPSDQLPEAVEAGLAGLPWAGEGPSPRGEGGMSSR